MAPKTTTITSGETEIEVTHNGRATTAVTVRSTGKTGLSKWPAIDLDNLAAMFGSTNGVTHRAEGTDITSDTAAPTKRAAKAASTKAPAKKAAKGIRAKIADKPANAEGGGRTYRRLADEEKFVEAYAANPNVAALAALYEVPGYTIDGWIRRLKGQGKIPT